MSSGRKQPGRAPAKERGGSAPAAAQVPVAPEPLDGNTGRNLRRAIRVLFGEAVVAGVVAIVAIWSEVAGGSVSVSSAIATPAIFALIAAVLAGLGVALARGKGLARGPAIMVQMLLVPIGISMVIGGLAWLGVPVLIAGLCGCGFLLAPSTRTALGLD